MNRSTLRRLELVSKRPLDLARKESGIGIDDLFHAYDVASLAESARLKSLVVEQEVVAAPS